MLVIQDMKHHKDHQAPFWKLALGGMAAGTALYFFPFLVPALAFVLLAGLLLRGVFAGPGMYMRHAFAARWQTMNEEQRSAMRERYAAHGCGPWHKMHGEKSNTNNA